MRNIFYGLFIDAKTSTYDVEIGKAVETIEKYNLWSSNDASADTVSINSREFFKRIDGSRTVYDLFYENIHIHISNGAWPSEQICSIRVKKQGENWECPIKFSDEGERMIDASHPNNDSYEVYVWYDVPVLDVTRSVGYVYKHGNWDKYVYKTMKAFFGTIIAETDTSKFNEDYK